MITPRILFLKSEPQQPKAGEHWITVRPPGHEKGQPILVQDQPDGSMKVVGGAGGALNHLRFTPGHKGEDRKAVAAKRQEEARAAKKARIERDKELGLHEAKQGVRKKLADQRRAAEKEFISSVADQMGWDKAQLEFPAEKFAHLSGLGGVFGQLDRVALVGEDFREQGADAKLVVDYQDCCHAL